MKKPLTYLSMFLCAAALVLTGCEGGGDGDPDVGDNDPNVVACIGDSITAGYACIGAPVPTRLAAKSGKTVLNFGQPGAESSYGVAVVGAVLANKPGYVFIMLGSNDASSNHDPLAVKANVTAIVVACKSNHSIPIVATPPQMAYGHAIYNSHCGRVAECVREVAREQGVKLVDIYAAFGSNAEKYLNPDDGLHLSEEGGEFIADKFNSAL